MRDELEKSESGVEYGVHHLADASEVYDAGDGDIFEEPDARSMSRPSTPEVPFR